MSRALLSACIACLPLACTAQTSSTPPPASASAHAPASSPAPASASPAERATPATPAGPKVTYTACNVEGPFIAMTFDDGPHATNTPRLLNMLKERGIKATFYMVGQCVAEYPDIVKRIAEEGHEVANHSWSHPLLSNLSDAAVREQLQKTHDAIQKASGVAPKTMRPPYGGFTERQRRWVYGELGYKVILWDVDPLDWKVRNAAHVENEILRRTTRGSIILTHDIHKSTIDAMPATLDALTAKGFKFVTVSELIAMDKPAPPKPKATPKPAQASPAAAGQIHSTKAHPAAPATAAPSPAPLPSATPAASVAPVPTASAAAR